MATQQPVGLVDRKTADQWATGVFVLLLILGCLVLYSVVNEPPQKTTTVIKTTKQHVTGAKTPAPQTETIETTVEDVPVSVWERLLGRRIAILLVAATALLAAFVGGGVVQRVLLGQYAFTLGPLTVPAISTDDVAKAAQAATQGLAAQAPQSAIERASRGAKEIATSTNLAWLTTEDPNLALAGWRIDLEQQLRRLARAYGIDDQGNANEILRRLLGRGVIQRSAADALQQLLDIATRAIHGDRVDPSVVDVLRTSGHQILIYLDGLSDGR